jgi:inner membrane protein involved in colicin E2 resistance
MGDIFGKLIGLILAFILLLLVPLSIVVLMEEVADRRSIINEVSNIIDEIADTRTLTDAQIADFYAGVSSYGPLVDVTIYRYIRTINPDGSTTDPDDTYTSYVISENLDNWFQGDICKVRVRAIGYTGAQRYIMGTFGIMLPEFDFTLAGRVR